MRNVVLSFFDYTGHAVRPWAEAGYICYCFDILHKSTRDERVGRGVITYLHADLEYSSHVWDILDVRYKSQKNVAMIFSWPPCDDLTGSGAKHFELKRQKNPDFQMNAVKRAVMANALANSLGSPFMIENPVGKLNTMWRKPDHIWDPYEFGGYLPEDDVHPEWPEYIAPRDAYPKKTCAWVGNGFKWPEKKPVNPEILERVTKSGRTLRGSRQFMKLGGTSKKTKEIRNQTPRGFAQAVFEANHKG